MIFYTYHCPPKKIFWFRCCTYGKKEGGISKIHSKQNVALHMVFLSPMAYFAVFHAHTQHLLLLKMAIYMHT